MREREKGREEERERESEAHQIDLLSIGRRCQVQCSIGAAFNYILKIKVCANK